VLTAQWQELIDPAAWPGLHVTKPYHDAPARDSPATTDPTAMAPSPDAVAAFKLRAAARQAEIKRGLEQHLATTAHPVGDYVSASRALLELACERYIEIHEDAVEAFDFIERAFRRV
jgi:hypothetical protein